jgi:hypothetical protein
MNKRVIDLAQPTFTTRFLKNKIPLDFYSNLWIKNQPREWNACDITKNLLILHSACNSSLSLVCRVKPKAACFMGSPGWPIWGVSNLPNGGKNMLTNMPSNYTKKNSSGSVIEVCYVPKKSMHQSLSTWFICGQILRESFLCNFSQL